MEPEFKIAEESDIDLLLELMREFYEYDRIPYDRAIARAALDGIINDGNQGSVWLIGASGETVGYAALTFGYSLEYHGRDAFLDELFIREPHRRKGIGKQVLKFVEKNCSELGIRGLHLVVERKNTNAQNFYRAFGFQTQDRYLMTRWIAQEPTEGLD